MSSNSTSGKGSLRISVLTTTPLSSKASPVDFGSFSEEVPEKPFSRAELRGQLLSPSYDSDSGIRTRVPNVLRKSRLSSRRNVDGSDTETFYSARKSDLVVDDGLSDSDDDFRQSMLILGPEKTSPISLAELFFRARRRAINPERVTSSSSSSPTRRKKKNEKRVSPTTDSPLLESNTTTRTTSSSKKKGNPKSHHLRIAESHSEPISPVVPHALPEVVVTPSGPWDGDKADSVRRDRRWTLRRVASSECLETQRSSGPPRSIAWATRKTQVQSKFVSFLDLK